ncbi:MAG: radical SAM protein [Candidatus Aenigmarchaeota archaeon]|nr:radical SAM protein [Candidatus Aenigmarchaeota archaeon]
MKVLILNPPGKTGYVKEGRCEQKLSSWQYVMVPISLPYIAAVLRESGFEVKIIDAVAEDTPIDILKDHVISFEPDLTIVNTSTPTFREDMLVVDVLKKISKSFFAAIGVHVTVLPDESMEKSKLDFIVRGEPEISCLKLAEALKSKENVNHVKGISYKKDGKIINNPDRPLIEDLDSLPFPARDLLKNEKYTMPIYNRPYTLLVPSRGCPSSCIYCTANVYYGKKCRERSCKNIVDEIEEILNVHKISDITMWSDTFTLKKNFVIEICDEIKRRGLKFNWMCNSRVNTIDPEMLKRMKDAGCSIISYGVESGVKEILDNAKKGINIKQIEDAIKWTNDAGIESIAHVIFGLPGETKETVEKTIDFIKKINPTYAQFYCATPFHGTEFYEIAKKNNWLTTEDWDEFEINNPIIKTDKMSIEDLHTAKIKAYKAFYLRPGYAFSTIKRIKSIKDLIRAGKQGMSFIREWVIESD